MARAPRLGAKRVRQSTSRAIAEQRADHAGERVVRGATQIGRDVGTAPAASASIAGSAGHVLAPRLRAYLERAFDADLAAVRLHTDASAVDATRKAGAHAFTAGRDVFTALPVHALCSERGLRLLGHEIAHVLQQTGRRDATGRLHATATTGTAPVQYKEDTYLDGIEEAGLFSGDIDFSVLEQQYAGFPGASVHLQTIRSLVGAGGTASSTDALAKAATSVVANASDEIRALYVDALKWAGAYPAAAKLLTKYPALQTAFRSRAFYEYMRGLRMDWLGARVASFNQTKALYPDAYARTFELFFFSGDSALPKTAAAAKRSVDELLETIPHLPGRGENELGVVALWSVSALEEVRASWLPKVISVSASRRAELTETLSDVAGRYVTGKATDEQISGAKVPELTQLFAAVFPQIQGYAQAAATFWSRAKAFYVAQRGGKSFEDRDVAETAAMANAIKGDKRFAKLASTILEVEEPLLARPGRETAKRLGTAVRKGLSKLNALVASYSGQLRGLLAKEDEQPALQIGMVLHYLERLTIALDGYTASGGEDARVATQIRVARIGHEIGKRFGFAQVLETSDAFLRSGTYVALLSEWTADRAKNEGEIQVDALANDIREKIVGYEGTGIDPKVLGNFVYAAYYDRLADALQEVRAEASLEVGQRKEALLLRAKQRIKDAPRAKRYYMRDWDYSDPRITMKPADAAKVSSSFAQLVLDHPKTLAFRKKHQQHGELALTYASPPNVGSIALWLIPRLDDIVATIATPEVIKLVAENWARHHGNESPPDPTTQPLAWLSALGELATGMSEDARRKLAAQAGGKLARVFQSSEERAFAEGRLATSEDRRQLVDTIAGEWRAYDANDPRTFRRADAALRGMQTFVALIFPRSDRALQVTAMMIELAPALIGAVGSGDRPQIVGEVVTLAAGASEMWRTHRAQVLSIKRMEVADRTYQVHAHALDSFARTLEEEVVGTQRDNGFSANLADDKITELHLGATVKTGKQFYDMQGTAYGVNKIYRSFRFHPAYSGHINWGVEFPGRGNIGKALLLDADGNPLARDGKKLLEYVLVEKKGDKPKIIEVTSSIEDEPKLHVLAAGIADASGLALIEEVGVVVNKVAEIVLEVLEFIPGVGQAISAARFLVALIDFLVSPEFELVMDALSKDGLRAIPKLFERFSILLDAATLLTKLLFSDPLEITPPGNEPPTQTEKGQKSGFWAKIATAIKNVFLVCKRLWGRFKAVVNWVRFPFEALQDWVLQHPAATVLLGFILEYWDRLSALAIDIVLGPEEKDDEPGERERSKLSFDGVVDEILSRAEGTVAEIINIQIPGTIIQESVIVDWVIDTVKLGMKATYRKGFEAARSLLSTLGVWDKITSKIGEGFSALGLDPNPYWQKKVAGFLNPKITSVRDWLVKQLLGMFAGVKFLARRGETTKEPLKVGFDDADEFSEADAFPAVDEHPTGATGALPTPSGGAPIPESVRTRAESGLGHDFSHVRLHSGSEGERVTSAFSAEGITTGSHVYLRPGLTPTGGFGRQVLHHELSHVIQQTGPRPLGGDYSNAPVAGAASRGLNYDPSREAAADRAASRASSDVPIAAPADVGGRSSGLQPMATDEFLKKLLRNLSKPGPRKTEEQLARRAKHAAGTLTQDTRATNIASALKSVIVPSLTATTTPYKDSFDKARVPLKAYIDAHADTIRASMDVIVEESAEVVPGGMEGEKKLPGVYYVVPSRVALAIERLLFKEFGLGFKIRVKRTDRRERIGTKDREVIDTTAPFKSISLEYVDIQGLSSDAAGEAVWTHLLGNTFKDSTDYAQLGDEIFRMAAKLILGRGPRWDTFQSKAPWRFSARVAKSVTSLAKRIKPLTDDAWPSPEDYVRTEGTGTQGLRVGTYGVWGPLGNKKNQRQAHHITQYLLPQFLSNKASSKPFLPSGLGLYPGLEIRKQLVNKITSGGKSIDVGKYYSDGRGNDMPIVFLSTYAHQSGIHFERSRPDEPGQEDATPTQSYTLYETFRDKAILHFSEDESATKEAEPIFEKKESRALYLLKKLAAASSDNYTEGIRLTKKKVREAIFAAAQETFVVMEKDMRPKLDVAVREREVQYYNEIARQKRMPEKLTPDKVEEVLKKATKMNDDFAQDAGFK